MPKNPLRLVPLGAAVFAAACAIPPETELPAGLASPFTGYRSALYGDDRMWLCRPDLASDPCHRDLTAVEIGPDGRRAVVRHAPAAAPKVDCFYVYPTLDMRLLPGNQADFDELAAVEQAARSQAARFSEVCAVYAPLYRQITIGTYAAGVGQRLRRLEVAFSDVEDAFAHYLGQYNRGRKIVLIGHSQGAEMVVRLLRRFFENDPALRDRLLLAMPIGSRIEVPRGRAAGATFATIPMCTKPDEIGCIVAYRSYRAGAELPSGAGWAPTPGNESVCVNPADIGGEGPRRLSRSYFATSGPLGEELRGVQGVTAPFVLLRGFYTGACVEGPDGFRYFAVAAAPLPGDRRVSPIDLEATLLNLGFGLHPLDIEFPLGDLIDLTARRAARLP